MKKAFIISVYLLCLSSSSYAANDAEELYRRGLAKLREAQADQTKLVEATKLLVEASDQFEADGNESKATELNSCIYWARKKMTLADTDALKENAQVNKKWEAASKPVDNSQAQNWLQRADEFAKNNPNDALLIAIAYFEVGDRFKDTEQGRKAINASLAAMQNIAAGKLPEYKPKETDGKVFVQSEPAGAQIVLINDGIRKDTGKKTPSIIQLPKGRQTLLLELKSMNAAQLEVEIIEGVISKTEAIKLEPKTEKIDIVFESGWTVFLSGKLMLSQDRKRMITPCTVYIAAGIHDIALAKVGFKDIYQKVNVKNGAAIEIASKPIGGTSSLLKSVDILPEMTSTHGLPKQTPEGIQLQEVKGSSKTVAGIRSESIPGPLKITALVKTNSQVRLECGAGEVIFGWEVNPKELRYHDIVTGAQSGIKDRGTIAPNVWHTITWVIQNEVTSISLDGREVFSKKGNYENFRGPVGIRSAAGSLVDVKSFTVESLSPQKSGKP